VISGPAGANGGAEADDAAAAVVGGFEGVELDGEAQAAIMAALEACAARARAADAAYERGGEEAADYAAGDPDEPFVSLPHNGTPWRGELLPPTLLEDALEPEGEDHWRALGSEAAEEPGAAGASG
jgi:hypothetical protein